MTKYDFNLCADCRTTFPCLTSQFMSWDVSPVDFQNQGLVSHAQVFKVGMSDVEFEPFAPHGEALGFELPRRVTAPGVGFMARLCPSFSYLFDVVYILFAQCVVITQPAFWLLYEEIVPYVAVDLVCPLEETYSGSS